MATKRRKEFELEDRWRMNFVYETKQAPSFGDIEHALAAIDPGGTILNFSMDHHHVQVEKKEEKDEQEGSSTD